ncbi:MAG: TrkH family potassium uptake protein [Planctomycetota bacterium]
MNFKVVLLVLSRLAQLLGCALLVPLFVSWGYGDEPGVVRAFAGVAALSLGGGSFLRFLLRRTEFQAIGPVEGFASVSLVWLGAAALGALPFWWTGALPSYTDAFFETMSGFTTTGASIIGLSTGTRIEDLATGLLFWRSFTHWLGGMGIVVLFVAVLPALGAGGSQLFRAEVPSPTKDRISPRISETAKILWYIYSGLSLAEVLLLWIAGMPLFDAVCHTFGTMATGGFSTQTASIGAYGSLIQWIIIVFMVLAGMNFVLHFHLMRGRIGVVWGNPELRAYLGLILVSVVALSIALWVARPEGTASTGQTVRDSTFQVVSIVTTTGYATADFGAWPKFCGFLLLSLMCVGACAGSTGGGMKIFRLMVFVRFGLREIQRLLQPRAVIAIKMGGRSVADEIVDSITGFFVLWFLVLFAAMAILQVLGIEFLTSVSAVVACLSNIGPGLGAVGPTGDYGFLPGAAKWLLSFCMLFGRLELYSVLVLLLPSTWLK